MKNEVGNLWENRTHPGHFIFITAKKREHNKRYYYTFYYLDEPETILLIDIDKLNDVFKKVS
jgi:hypothetical protein